MRIMLWLAAVWLPAAAAAATLQEQYSAAQAKYDAGEMAAARAGFAAVLPRLEANPKMKTQAAIVRVRMGAAATALGDPETGATEIAAALPALDAAPVEWTEAQLELGVAHELAVDFDAAASAYRAVLTRAAPRDGAWLSATIGLARVLTFSDPNAARGFADAALAVVDTMQVSAPLRGQYAQLLALRGRIDLNDGKAAAARVWFDKAMAHGRRLGNGKVSIADVRIRGDLALAAFKTGDLETTRKYLAYTGAGSLPSQGFEFGAEMPLPSCAPVGAVARDDMAIIEFSIDNEGRVVSVSPILASSAVAATEFARAVRGWSWSRESVKTLPAFWRAAVRLELRCVNRGPGAARSDLPAALKAWMMAQGPVPSSNLADAVALPALRDELARRAAADGAASPRLIPVLMAIGENAVAPPAEALAAVSRARTIASAVGAPQDLITAIRLREAVLAVAASRVRGGGDVAHDTTRRLTQLLADLDREGAGQTYGAAMVAGCLALWAQSARGDAAMTAAYRRVLATPLAVLPNGATLRQTARLQLAAVEAAASRLDSARQLLAETGLTAEQCSAIPVAPRMLSANVGADDFPRAAMAWNLEGLVRVAYDIDVRGRPLEPRAVVASPPLIFSAATENAAKGFRYQPLFRDGASIGCADMQRTVLYKIR